jgi:hypothetical protein
VWKPWSNGEKLVNAEQRKFYQQGIRAAAEFAGQFDQQIDHRYRFEDTILFKFCLLPKGKKPRVKRVRGPKCYRCRDTKVVLHVPSNEKIPAHSDPCPDCQKDHGCRLIHKVVSKAVTRRRRPE